MKKVSVVIPTYNEQDNVTLLANTLTALPIFANNQYQYELIFVDDGSKDASLQNIKTLQTNNSNIHYIQLSKNCGHQNALKAGIDLATGHCVVSMDADMQHPPEVVPQLIALWEQGYDIVYTKRTETAGTGAIKNATSTWFYTVLNTLSEVELEEGTADFRLIDQKIVKQIKTTKEVELFFRAYIKAMGFKQIAITYAAAQRNAGQSKYTFKKMVRLALVGITSFSVKPLHFAAYLGVLLAFLSLLFLPYVLYSYITGSAASGWSSLILTVVFFGGLQLFVLGIIGVYIGKIFKQVKQQPLYYIADTSLTQHGN
jgi:polyisoprenyl-phosphate glycosyltransferase